MTSNERGVWLSAARHVKGKYFIDAFQVKQWIKDLVVSLVGLTMLDTETEQQMKACKFLSYSAHFVFAVSSIYGSCNQRCVL
ncbi:hypothetical protein ACFPAG_16640 [Vogesella sp. GCM10023246]|uniref:Transposase DDE domain-containing protein n=1 Tax=Vogesella oryzagri TaxID=3160864 RepID=A0ABV1M7P4_9NEIS